MKCKKLFVGAFLLIIFGVFLLIPIDYVLVKKNIISIDISDNYQVFEPKEEHNILDKIDNLFGNAKNKLENLINNYFPFYARLNKAYQDFNYESNALLPSNDIPLGTDTDGEYIFYQPDGGFYYHKNKYTVSELDERLETQVKFFNGLADKGLDIYIYIPGRYELSTIPKDNINKYIDTFKKGLSDDIHIDNMVINNVDEYKNYFYLTDHHWNINGALKGYYQIMDMMGTKKLEDLNVVTHEDREFYGSFAKSTMTDKTFDYINDVDIKLDYTVTVNGKKPSSIYKPRYVRLDRTSNKYYDYYVQYFNGQYGNIIYDYHNEDAENLLIMSDSFVWEIDYLIAASFNKTHVINLRYDAYKNKKFDLSSYVKENNISKVLFLYEGESTMFDQYNYNFIGRVS